ncbi:hypothetical protein BU16DRAFT_561177 [Lophium mytilinum]|uniref:Uncharacterized protein n=1 Tax=Lophium mytilinum TaxID=390894 RepID=A0A6A6QZ29_9PEZI|nr:hypothetical protein BU16DRAFT_561177 [Lophium mytilinum]
MSPITGRLIGADASGNASAALGRPDTGTLAHWHSTLARPGVVDGVFCSTTNKVQPAPRTHATRTRAAHSTHANTVPACVHGIPRARLAVPSWIARWRQAAAGVTHLAQLSPTVRHAYYAARRMASPPGHPAVWWSVGGAVALVEPCPAIKGTRPSLK